jgi:hypothetical protein
MTGVMPDVYLRAVPVVNGYELEDEDENRHVCN